MRTLGILFLILCSSCVNIPVMQRCHVSFVFNKCRCGMYDMNLDEFVTIPQDYPLSHCNNLVGFSYEDWQVELSPRLKEICRKRGKCKD